MSQQQYKALQRALPEFQLATGEYSDLAAARICELRAQGHTLEEIAAITGVSWKKQQYWRTHFPIFAQAWDHADELRAEQLVENMSDVCQKALNGTVETRAVGAVLQNMQWRAAAMNRKRFGDKQEVKLTGGFALVIHTDFDPNAHSAKPPPPELKEVRGEVLDAE